MEEKERRRSKSYVSSRKVNVKTIMGKTVIIGKIKGATGCRATKEYFIDYSS